MKQVLGRPARHKAAQDSAPVPAPVVHLAPGASTNSTAVPKPAVLSAGITPPIVRSGKDPRRKINYFWDEASLTALGELRVLGWALCELGSVEVAVTVDGEVVGKAELGMPRSDVGRAFPLNSMAGFAGFRFQQLIPGLAGGEHVIHLVLRSALDEERSPGKRLRTPVQVPATVATSPPASADPPEFRFELDSPQMVGGVVPGPITGRLTIEGWVVARSGVAGIDVSLDDVGLGEAYYGLARQDVGAALPDWEHALRSGYAFHCPPRALSNGTHQITLTVRARNGRELVRRFPIEVKKSETLGKSAGVRQRMPQVEAAMLTAALDRIDHQPQFHLLLCQPATIMPDRLRATFDSLRTQVYDRWQLTVLTADPGSSSVIRQMLADCRLAARATMLDPRERSFGSMLGAVNDAGILYGALCPGDLLGCDALLEIALASARHREATFFYADEVRLNPANEQREPFFKPDFSPDLLLSTNYIGRPWFAAAALLRQCRVSPRSLLAYGEYDLVLRCAEQARAVHHVSKLLADRGPDTLDGDAQSRTALVRAAKRRRIAATVLPGCVPGSFRLRRARRARGKVSIIIPTCGTRGLIQICLRTLRKKTAYSDYEIICVDNIMEGKPDWKIWLTRNADKIVDVPEPFNWSRFNNKAVDSSEGEYLLFLNDDIEIEQEDWLDELMEHAARPEVGIVGPQLLYPDRKVQHAGMFLGDGIGRHAFRFTAPDDPGYFGLALTQRNVIAVTGACMLMRRSFFESLGRFEEAYAVINSDVDFCLRAHQTGKLIVFTPHATLIHHEHATLIKHEVTGHDRTQDMLNNGHFERRWRTLFAAGDPYFNPNLSRHSDDYQPDEEQTQSIFAGHPIFRRESIRRILVMKLDHIGDFVTALPAIRQLKKSFPDACITVLAGRAARALGALEPAIDEFIEFEFFHPRSQLGEKNLTKEDFARLEGQLHEYQFDLAIDLRQHHATREVLRYTGARILAGFDTLGRFPFLDIAPEWDGDNVLHRKRSHIVDDLLALVDAVNAACTKGPEMLVVTPEPIVLETLPESVQTLFARPVVAVHPGAGNVTKLWPEKYFSALIDLLVERNGVNVLLVGGPDDRALAETLMHNALLPDRLASMAGSLPLEDLPRLLVRCALYIGNDTGPKHIAAALGIPTIGVHSGVVDATAWGPMGRRAVALQRNMRCSPCYLARAEDCPRQLACLRFLEPSSVHRLAEMLLVDPVAAPPVQQIGEGATMLARPNLGNSQNGADDTKWPVAASRAAEGDAHSH